MSSNLTGVWFGAYTYSDGEKPVSFMANVDDVRGFLSGKISEKNTFAEPGCERLLAWLDGSHDQGLVTFAKTYDGSGGVNHTVSYTGRLNGDASLISGRWTIGPCSGGFSMSRPVLTPDEDVARSVIPLAF